MRNERIIKLINKSLDGILTGRERKILEKALKQNPEMQILSGHLQNVSGILEHIPQIDPPSGLSKRVMNSLDLNRYPKVKPKPAPVSFWRGFSARAHSRLAIAFCAGVAVTSILFILTQDHRVEMPKSKWNDYYGTIGINEKLGFETSAKIPVETETIRGFIAQRQNNAVFGLEICLNTKKDFELWVGYDPKFTRWNGIKPLNGMPFGFETGDDYVKIFKNADIQVLLFFMREGGKYPPFDLRLFQSKEIVWQGRIGGDLPVDE
jgi:hypothetical protein